jgi:hypothetical protein
VIRHRPRHLQIICINLRCQRDPAAGLKPGAMVRPVELFATPWARIFNGQLPDGVAYRAARLELVAAEAVQ